MAESPIDDGPGKRRHASVALVLNAKELSPVGAKERLEVNGTQCSCKEPPSRNLNPVNVTPTEQYLRREYEAVNRFLVKARSSVAAP
jgi:hypothetical protein